ncbi:hypothetical protein BT63DRAFT_290679 [Microthyrium microscopicum]|uniref:Uncharacterized protein n=1 Tax=Microthyrium microscopicum TaxID=703497 RepID=A0A6A6U8D4_9PEZI|nr:hypothetical protein BT63DRAFT_290679 [Microthyrium microscopicum]
MTLEYMFDCDSSIFVECDSANENRSGLFRKHENSGKSQKRMVNSFANYNGRSFVLRYTSRSLDMSCYVAFGLADLHASGRNPILHARALPSPMSKSSNFISRMCLDLMLVQVSNRLSCFSPHNTLLICQCDVWKRHICYCLPELLETTIIAYAT